MSDDVLAVSMSSVRNESESFEAFYRLHYATVLRVAFAVTGDAHRAADVAQDAFVTAQRRWSSIGSYDRPDLWVRRVAINRALSWRRRAANELLTVGRLALRRERAVVSDAQSDSDVWHHVRLLPRQQASMIALVYVDDMSIEQAAETLGIAVPTAKTHLQRAKRTLARRLNEEVDDDR